MDRFHAKITKDSLLKEAPSWVHVGTICVLMAAKLQQPVSPSFNKMIDQLPDDKKKLVRKSELINLEYFIVSTLQFDLQWAGPLVTLERYL